MTNMTEYLDAEAQVERWNKIRDEASERILKSHFTTPKNLTQIKSGKRWTSKSVYFSPSKKAFVVELVRFGTSVNKRGTIFSLPQIMKEFFIENT